MELQHILGKIAGAMALSAFLPFIIAIWKGKGKEGKTKPSVVTWAIWSVVNLLLIKSYYDSGAHNTLWLPKAFFVGDVAIFFLALKYGERTVSYFESICIGLTMVNIFSIFVFSYNHLLVLYLCVATLFIGGLPTIKKSWLRPQNENKMVWTIFATAGLLNLCSIENWHSFAIIAHPLYVVAIDVTVAIILWIRGIESVQRFVRGNPWAISYLYLAILSAIGLVVAVFILKLDGGILVGLGVVITVASSASILCFPADYW